MPHSKQRLLTACLFTLYLLFLIWVIVFKMKFSLQDIAYYRSLNLIPLKGSAYGQISAEVKSNVFIFIPFGLFLAMLKGKWSLFKKILVMASVSLAFEATQYALAIGASDITDVIGNTLGGIGGILLYALCRFLFKGKTDRYLNTAAVIISVGLFMIFVLPLLLNT